MTQRANYVYLVDYKPTLDPRNEGVFTSTIYAGEMEFAIRLTQEEPLKMNWFAMPEWQAPEWNGQLVAAKSQPSLVKIKSEVVDSEIDFNILLPSGYSNNTDQRYPVIYVFDGMSAITAGKVDEISQFLFERNPDSAAILVFINGMAAGPAVNQLLTQEIVPYVDANYRTQANRSGRSCFGTSFNCMGVLMCVAEHSDVFSAASVQSPLLFDAAQALIAQAFQKVAQPVKIRLEWGRYDLFNPHENWDVRVISQNIWESIDGQPNVELSGGMVDDSTDWPSWQNRLDVILKFLTQEN
ncbi:MAG: alpha/beta hydrolase-fold protein [Pirellulaceae bacterium]